MDFNLNCRRRLNCGAPWAFWWFQSSETSTHRSRGRRLEIVRSTCGRQKGQTSSTSWALGPGGNCLRRGSMVVSPMVGSWCSHMQPRELTPSFLQLCPGILGISWDVLTIDD
ncbi:unnamed protein product [Cladocopium goreaui]|uniref:Uncharacterized protein n=1 Tax=Cladocopium goreaui TaxID=2562237 RepID=A0A9P1BJD3_9DINO|nr:unnamed protein product [Cladocopium goreaui]